MPVKRDFSAVPGRELQRVEFLLPAALLRKLTRVSSVARHRGLVRGRDQVVQEVLEAWLAEYESKVLEARAAAKEAADGR